jgi:hypothetical protein
MRPALLLLTFLAVGCSQPKPPVLSGPQLRFVGVGVNHTTFPMPFAIKVRNDGDPPAYVDDAQIFVATKTLLYDDETSRGSVPDGFDCDVIVFSNRPGTEGKLVPLPRGEAIEIAPGATVDVLGAVQWAVPADAPPMLAIVRASFAAMNDGKVVAQGDERLYVLQSREGAVEAVRNSTTTDGDEARAVLKGLRALDGERSRGFVELLESIQAFADREI